MSIPRAKRILLQVYDNVFTLEEYILHEWSVQLPQHVATACAPLLNETLVAKMEQSDVFPDPLVATDFACMLCKLISERNEQDLPPDVISSYLLENENYFLTLFNFIESSRKAILPNLLDLLYQFLKNTALFTCLENENVIQRTGK